LDDASATEITVMPIHQIGTDAAILFSDILVVPQAMNVEVQMKDGIGPWLPNPIRSMKDVEQVIVPNVHEELVRILTKQKLFVFKNLWQHIYYYKKLPILLLLT